MKKYLVCFALVGLVAWGLVGFTALVSAGDPVPGIDVSLQQITAKITTVDLGVENPGILPTSGFYFLKEWRRSVARIFTFNSVKKTELELNITNEKAAETIKVQETNPDNAEAINKAVANYEKNQTRLMTRIEKLKETSQNPNVDALLTKVVDRLVKHEQLFDEIAQKAKKEQAEGDAAGKNIRKNITVTLAAASQKDEPEKFAKRLEKALDESKGGDLKHARSVEFIDNLNQAAPEALKSALGKARENLSVKLAENVGNLLEKENPGALDELVQAAENHSSRRKNVKLAIKNIGGDDKAVESIMSMVDDEYIPSEENHNTTRSNKTSQMIKAGISQDDIDKTFEVAVKEEGVQQAEAAKGRGYITGKGGDAIVPILAGYSLDAQTVKSLVVGMNEYLVALKNYNSSKSNFTIAIKNIGGDDKAVESIMSMVDDEYIPTLKNYNASKSNTAETMISAGVSDDKIEKILSMVEGGIKERGVLAQARKYLGAVKYESITRILAGIGITEENVNKIMDGLDDLAQASVDYNSSRSNVKLIMKNAGVSDDKVEEILSLVSPDLPRPEPTLKAAPAVE